MLQRISKFASPFDVLELRILSCGRCARIALCVCIARCACVLLQWARQIAPMWDAVSARLIGMGRRWISWRRRDARTSGRGRGRAKQSRFTCKVGRERSI
jgi:hypothetical protein